MNERIKTLRKYFKLTQDGFAARIGVKRGAIANYEIGRNIPADSVVSLICREFKVREEWLRNGSGEMFDPTQCSALDALASERNLTRGEYVLIEKLLDLKPDVRRAIVDYIVSVAAAISADGSQEKGEPASGLLPEELHAELDRQLAAEKEAGGKSEAS